MHEDPKPPTTASPAEASTLALALALEPCSSPPDTTSRQTAPDGWALHTADRSRAAHVQHTVAITADSPRIL